MTYNQISIIEPHTFSYLYYIVKFYLTGNCILNDQNAFFDNPEVEYFLFDTKGLCNLINLSYNVIYIFKNRTFEALGDFFNHLDLRGNKLIEIETHAFKDISRLEHL